MRRVLFLFLLAVGWVAAGACASCPGPGEGPSDAGLEASDGGNGASTDGGGAPLGDAGGPDAGDGGLGGDGGEDGGDDGGPGDSGVDAGPKTGCGVAWDGGDWDIQMSFQGVSRALKVHLPLGYDPAQKTPLVFNFHGLGSNSLEEMYVSVMNPVADEKGFVAVYPDGVHAIDLAVLYPSATQRSWNAGGCCGVAQQENVDDVGFVRAALAVLEETYCVDPKRVFATGLSNGGLLSYRLGCELSDRIAAISPVAGINAMAVCQPGRPVPLLHFHGTADALVAYAGGSLGPSVPANVAGWAQKNGCAGPTAVTYLQGAVECRTHTGCPDAGTATLCTVDGGGHTWPDGLVPPMFGTTTHDINATRAMWDFFVQNPMP